MRRSVRFKTLYAANVTLILLHTIFVGVRGNLPSNAANVVQASSTWTFSVTDWHALQKSSPVIKL